MIIKRYSSDLEAHPHGEWCQYEDVLQFRRKLIAAVIRGVAEHRGGIEDFDLTNLGGVRLLKIRNALDGVGPRDKNVTGKFNDCLDNFISLPLSEFLDWLFPEEEQA